MSYWKDRWDCLLSDIRSFDRQCLSFVEYSDVDYSFKFSIFVFAIYAVWRQNVRSDFSYYINPGIACGWRDNRDAAYAGITYWYYFPANCGKNNTIYINKINSQQWKPNLQHWAFIVVNLLHNELGNHLTGNISKRKRRDKRWRIKKKTKESITRKNSC